MKLVEILLSHMIASALVAFLAMLTLGVAHHDISPAVPALGYLPCLVIICAVSSATRFISFSIKGGL